MPRIVGVGTAAKVRNLKKTETAFWKALARACIWPLLICFAVCEISASSHVSAAHATRACRRAVNGAWNKHNYSVRPLCGPDYSHVHSGYQKTNKLQSERDGTFWCRDIQSICDGLAVFLFDNPCLWDEVDRITMSRSDCNIFTPSSSLTCLCIKLAQKSWKRANADCTFVFSTKMLHLVAEIRTHFRKIHVSDIGEQLRRKMKRKINVSWLPLLLHSTLDKKGEKHKKLAVTLSPEFSSTFLALGPRLCGGAMFAGSSKKSKNENQKEQ